MLINNNTLLHRKMYTTFNKPTLVEIKTFCMLLIPIVFIPSFLRDGSTVSNGYIPVHIAHFIKVRLGKLMPGFQSMMPSLSLEIFLTSHYCKLQPQFEPMGEPAATIMLVFQDLSFQEVSGTDVFKLQIEELNIETRENQSNIDAWMRLISLQDGIVLYFLKHYFGRTNKKF